jgi:hypothetical protein
MLARNQRRRDLEAYLDVISAFCAPPGVLRASFFEGLKNILFDRCWGELRQLPNNQKDVSRCRLTQIGLTGRNVATMFSGLVIR